MKAEDRAFEHCCAKCVHDKFGCSMKLLSHGRNCIKCGNYIKGYHQAEKDLELSWEDIKEIYRLFKAVRNEWWGHEFSDYGICREVLKRFKEMKGNTNGK
jgi:hypothetical protein